MLFNSGAFAVFLPIVFVLYWFATRKRLKAQNLLLLGASYFFYGCWDWRFLFLLLFSTFLDYFTGLRMAGSSDVHKRKFWFVLSVGINLGFLGVFKYYNFFAESFAEVLAGLGLEVHPWTLQVILPVGISFYTFHGLSYVIDIYKKRIEAEHDFVDYALFVSFFPLLVAGPIERATHLLPQIKRPRTFDAEKAVDGLRQILWGLFKKIVVADNCAVYANQIFNNASDYSGSTLVMGALFFAFQIYGDFSGYSDIAIGTARLFGIDLLRNFAYPYFSRDIAEYWRRWHISLSTWFRDYLYIPLGGSRGNIRMRIRNTFIIFVVSGFWHGANWTFIVWGALNAVYFLPLLLTDHNRANLGIVASGKWFPSIREFVNILLTFGLTVFAWIFFRADDLTSAIAYVSGIFSPTLFSVPWLIDNNQWLTAGLTFLLIGVEWVGREGQFGLQIVGAVRSKPVRMAIYYALIVSLFWFGGREQQFIYFQF